MQVLFERMSAPLTTTVSRCLCISLYFRIWKIEKVTSSEHQELTQAVI